MKCVKVDLRTEEVPSKTSLTFWISGCTNNCMGCHNPFLMLDTGIEMTIEYVMDQIDKYAGMFDTVLFMGGDADKDWLFSVAAAISDYGYDLAWYSGSEYTPKGKQYFRFYKYGHYDDKRGPLTSLITNQVMIDTRTGETLNNRFWK